MSKGFFDNNKDNDAEASEHDYLQSFIGRMERKLKLKASQQGYDISSDRF